MTTRTALLGRRAATTAAMALGAGLALGACGLADRVGTPADPAETSITAPSDERTPAPAGTPATPAQTGESPAAPAIGQDDLDELTGALRDGEALEDEVGADMTGDSTE